MAARATRTGKGKPKSQRRPARRRTGAAIGRPSGARRSWRPRSRNSPRAALRRRGSTTSPAAPASPRARSISTSATRRACSRNSCARCSARSCGRTEGRADGRSAGARGRRDAIADLFVREIFGTRRKDVIRLIITEGPRFPKLAEFYYHEVIERACIAVMRALLTRAVARGELPNDALARFPQLLIAPALVRYRVERAVRPFRPARRARADARAPRSPVRRKERDMTRGRFAPSSRCRPCVACSLSPAATTASRRPTRAGSRPN